MKTWIIKITSAALLFVFLLSGCAEHRYYQRDPDDRGRYHHRHHHDNDRDEHHDNDRDDHYYNDHDDNRDRKN